MLAFTRHAGRGEHRRSCRWRLRLVFFWIHEHTESPAPPLIFKLPRDALTTGTQHEPLPFRTNALLLRRSRMRNVDAVPAIQDQFQGYAGRRYK